MKKFKKGQTVYFYKKTDSYMGTILSGTVEAATKHLLTKDKDILYTVSVPLGYWYGFEGTHTLKAENIYTSYKQAEKEHKDEIAYNALMTRLNKLDEAINKIFNEYADKIQANPGFATISLDNCGTKSLIVDGIGDLKEEFNKLQKEVKDIKKKLKKPSKKPVIKHDDTSKDFNNVKLDETTKEEKK